MWQGCSPAAKPRSTARPVEGNEGRESGPCLFHRVGGALAGETGDAAGVSESSNSVLSLVKPSLHVGKHSFGGVGWRASPGSRNWARGAEAEGGEGCAQALTSISSSALSSIQGIGLLAGFTGDSFQFLGEAIPVSQGLLQCDVFALGVLVLSALVSDGVGVMFNLTDEPVPAEDGPGSQQEKGQNFVAGAHTMPRYFGHLVTVTSCTWWRLMSQAER